MRFFLNDYSVGIITVGNKTGFNKQAVDVFYVLSLQSNEKNYPYSFLLFIDGFFY